MPRLINLNAGIFKIKIDLNDYFVDSVNVDPNTVIDPVSQEERYFVTLREPTTEEAFFLQKKGEDGDALLKLIPNLIIDHNFLTAEGSKMPIDELWKHIKTRSGATTKLVSDWSEAIPLAKANKQK